MAVRVSSPVTVALGSCVTRMLSGGGMYPKSKLSHCVACLLLRLSGGPGLLAWLGQIPIFGCGTHRRVCGLYASEALTHTLDPSCLGQLRSIVRSLPLRLAPLSHPCPLRPLTDTLRFTFRLSLSEFHCSSDTHSLSGTYALCCSPRGVDDHRPSATAPLRSRLPMLPRLLRRLSSVWPRRRRRLT